MFFLRKWTGRSVDRLSAIMSDISDVNFRVKCNFVPDTPFLPVIPVEPLSPGRPKHEKIMLVCKNEKIFVLIFSHD